MFPKSLMRGGASGRSPVVDVASVKGSGLGLVANHFDVVPVRTKHESCIVVSVVVRAQLTPNLTWSNMSSPDECGSARSLT